MRRGLMAWDPAEIPLDALQQRVDRLQAALAAAGLDALLLYTNFIRSGAVSYLTAFSPYWADGVLMVPRQGEPLFATTLTKRVASWVETVKPIGRAISSPAPGKVLAERLADARRIGVLELDALPAGLYDDMAAALPAAEIVDGGAAWAEARRTVDDVERRLLRHADGVAAAALDQVDPRIAADAGGAVGPVEREARLQGAEEVYVAAALDLDADRRFARVSGARPLGRRFAVRATVAYKGTWVRQARSWSRDPADDLPIRRAAAWFRRFAPAVDLGRPLAEQIAAGVASLPGATVASWSAEAAVGTRPLASVVSTAGLPAVVLAIGLTIDGVPWLGGGLAGLADLAGLAE